MRIVLWLLFSCLALVAAAAAEVGPVTVRLPAATAWTGQRISFFVELRTSGSFAGTPGFELPDLPGTLLIKVGSPVVGSQEIEGESLSVQSHEFALFSQRQGVLAVPPFPVSFAHRDGFTGPVREVRAEVPGLKIEIERPPGSERIGFLMTTDSFEVTETWEPLPGAVQVGTMFKRTIQQRASGLSGMALASPPVAAPEGVRIYPGEAETRDTTERGDFLGERRETLTYLVTRPGTVQLPALIYTWWNPKTEQLQSKTLEAATFEVLPAATAQSSRAESSSWGIWPWLLLGAAALCIGIGIRQRQGLALRARRYQAMFNPPNRVAARRLLAACRRHEATAAGTSWFFWRSTETTPSQPGPELHTAVLDLHRHLFGPGPAAQWRGDRLGRAFAQHLAALKTRSPKKPKSVLPLLNP